MTNIAPSHLFSYVHPTLSACLPPQKIPEPKKKKLPSLIPKLIQHKKTYHINLPVGCSVIVLRNNTEVGYLTASNKFLKFLITQFDFYHYLTVTHYYVLFQVRHSNLTSSDAHLNFYCIYFLILL